MNQIIIILLILGLYPYLLYPLIALFLLGLKKFILILLPQKGHLPSNELPSATLLITAYNEEAFVNEKISNTRQLNYPPEKLKVIWVTDGSTDATPEIISGYSEFSLLHQPERRGKAHAMQRGMGVVDTEIIVFSDANTYLCPNAILEIVKAFEDKKIGCVAGRKVVLSDNCDTAAPSGESTYWHFESTLKKLDSNLYTAVGAVGELFAIRRTLFEPVPEDTILDDLQISLNILKKGYRIAYIPEAWAAEYGSVNVAEEMKRKIRIAAGGFQLVSRNAWLFNIFRYPLPSFLFISHKFMRWAVTPLLLFIIPTITLISLFIEPANRVLQIFLALQMLFFGLAFIGYKLKDKQLRSKLIFLPYYFFVTNWAQILGFARFMRGNNSVAWERSKRIHK